MNLTRSESRNTMGPSFKLQFDGVFNHASTLEDDRQQITDQVIDCHIIFQASMQRFFPIDFSCSTPSSTSVEAYLSDLCSIECWLAGECRQYIPHDPNAILALCARLSSTWLWRQSHGIRSNDWYVRHAPRARKNSILCCFFSRVSADWKSSRTGWIRSRSGIPQCHRHYQFPFTSVEKNVRTLLSTIVAKKWIWHVCSF